MVITKPADLLQCAAIQKQVRENSRQSVTEIICKEVITCCEGLGIDMPFKRALLLSSDIVDTYPCDSIEDVTEVLKMARRGQFSFGHETRSTITMIHFTGWMAEHLENKARAREQAVSKQQNNVPDKYPEIDYEKYKARKAKEKEDKRGRHEKHRDKIHKEEAYQQFKEGYEKGKS